jgi:hypothetical protein
MTKVGAASLHFGSRGATAEFTAVHRRAAVRVDTSAAIVFLWGQQIAIHATAPLNIRLTILMAAGDDGIGDAPKSAESEVCLPALRRSGLLSAGSAGYLALGSRRVYGGLTSGVWASRRWSASAWFADGYVVLSGSAYSGVCVLKRLSMISAPVVSTGRSSRR